MTEFQVPGSFGIWLVDEQTLEIIELLFTRDGWFVFSWVPGNKELTMTSTFPIHTNPIGCAHWYSKVSKCSGPMVTGTDRCREHLSDLGIRVLTAEQVARTAEQAQTIIQEAGPEHLLSVIHDAQEGEDMRSEFDEAEAEKISVMWAVFTAAQGRK